MVGVWQSGTASRSAASRQIPEPPPSRRRRSARSLDSSGVQIADVMHVAGELDQVALDRIASFLVDPLLQTGTWGAPTSVGTAYEITLHPGVTDVAAATLVSAGRTLGVPLDAASSCRRVEFAERTDAGQPPRSSPASSPTRSSSTGTRTSPSRRSILWTTAVAAVEVVADPRAGRRPGSPGSGSARSLALDPGGMLGDPGHFRAQGRDPTDVELETLAQTWSEHCAHKTFRAAIATPDGTKIRPLLASAARRAPTPSMRPSCDRRSSATPASCRSHGDTSLALKAETHNHPSAVEPFGGANTGVGGVIRDVLGIAHRPIAVTDVLCFGPPDLDPADAARRAPAPAAHPRRRDRRRRRLRQQDRAADGRRRRVLRRPATRPTRWCSAAASASPTGCGPHDGPHPATRVVVGRRPDRARRHPRRDVLQRARWTRRPAMSPARACRSATRSPRRCVIDACSRCASDLYTAITDCGAGGLSSAVGEMGEGIGADVELELVPLKYPGLAPWEIWLSRGAGADGARRAPAASRRVGARCRRYGVEMTAHRHVHRRRRCVCAQAATIVARSRHRVPPRRPSAAPDDCRAAVPRAARRRRTPTDRRPRRPHCSACSRHRNIASKAAIDPPIRPRDRRRTRGATARRRRRGHADGVVLARPADQHGVAIGIGMNPWHGVHDPEAMAAAAVDEAMRNVVAVGADPTRSPCSTTSRGAIPRALDAWRSRRRGQRVLRRGRGVRRAVRVRQRLAQQRVRRRRRRNATRCRRRS